MPDATMQRFARSLYRRHHGAEILPSYLSWRSISSPDGRLLAVLGFRSAGDGPLYLERYVDGPIEEVVSGVIGVAVTRERIVEIGCLAAMPTGAILQLWKESAGSLQSQFDFAVATLTRPLQSQFRRVKLPFTQITSACELPDPSSRERWGNYYRHAPQVCVGRISEGAVALNVFAARGERRS